MRTVYVNIATPSASVGIRSDSDDDAEISDFEDAAPAQRVERAAPRRATAAKAISKYAEDSGSDDSDSGSD